MTRTIHGLPAQKQQARGDGRMEGHLFPGTEDQQPVGLLFFNPRMQAAYKAWLKALLAPINPHTGIPLAKDPALAMIHLQNEDSLLFWTEQAIKGKQLELLGRQFGEWAKKKYGSIPAARRAWNGESMREDDP